MTENRNIPTTLFQRDRCAQLSATVIKIKTFEELLEKRSGRPIVLFIGQGKKLEIDDQYIKGMKTCAFSLYDDLRDQKLKELAGEILKRPSPQSNTVR